MKERKYMTITVKNNKAFKEFDELCKKLGLKKATTIIKLIEQFNENPQKFLFNK